MADCLPVPPASPSGWPWRLLCDAAPARAALKTRRLIGAGWTEVDPDAAALAEPLAKGCYQRNLIAGWESLSGSTLRGEARRWGAGYYRSRQSLMKRLESAGLVVSERVGAHGRRILVIEAPSGAPLSTPCAEVAS